MTNKPLPRAFTPAYRRFAYRQRAAATPWFEREENDRTAGAIPWIVGAALIGLPAIACTLIAMAQFVK